MKSIYRAAIYSFTSALCAALISVFLTYTFTRYHFYQSVQYKQGLEFFTNYHFHLLSSLQDIEFASFLIADPNSEISLDARAENLSSALENFDKSLSDYISNGGVILLINIDEDLAMTILGLGSRTDLWIQTEPYNPTSDNFRFSVSMLYDLRERLKNVSVKDYINSYRMIAKGKQPDF